MVELETTVDRRHGVTFVTVVVRNERATPQRVRLESTLAGPVWPPRRNGIVDPEWTGRTWDGTIEAGRRRGIGFASPAAAVGPPVELVEVERAADGDRRVCVRTVLSTLERWTPRRRVTERA